MILFPTSKENSKNTELKKYGSLLFWHLKGMGMLLLLPIISVYICQPVYLVLTRFFEFGGFGQQYIADALFSEVLFLYPPLSVCWVYWCLHKYTDSDEREVYYIYKKSKLKAVMSLYICYIITIGPAMLCFVILFDKAVFSSLYVFIASVSFVYCGITYWLAYFFGSTRVILPMLFGYSFIVTAPYSYGFEFINYTSIAYGSSMQRIVDALFIFVAGVVFWIMGYILNLKYERFL